jgi:hypothetical protein
MTPIGCQTSGQTSKDHAAYTASKRTDGLTWRNTLNPTQGRYVAFAVGLLYGKRHDPQERQDHHGYRRLPGSE